MDEQSADAMKRLGGSQGTIQLALDALGQKQSSVDQVRGIIDCLAFGNFSAVESALPLKFSGCILLRQLSLQACRLSMV